MKLAIFWLSYLWFPFVFASLAVIWRYRSTRRYLAAGLLVLSVPLAWGRFIEPRILVVHEETIILSALSEASGDLKIALFSDMHIGMFSNAVSIERLVRRVNAENVDAIFIAGDFTYWLDPRKVPEAFAALKDANAPIFAVLGNHDVGFPGRIYGESLYGPLRGYGVTFVENRSYETEIGEQKLIIAGTSDLWQRAYTFDNHTAFPGDVPVIMLTHNPDMALHVPPDVRYDLMLAGHTHGGQVRLPIPGLTQAMIPTQYPFDTGLHRLDQPGQPSAALVYVTPGTGMVGLPIRFRRPPRIDILTLTGP